MGGSSHTDLRHIYNRTCFQVMGISVSDYNDPSSCSMYPFETFRQPGSMVFSFFSRRATPR